MYYIFYDGATGGNPYYNIIDGGFRRVDTCPYSYTAYVYGTDTVGNNLVVCKAPVLQSAAIPVKNTGCPVCGKDLYKVLTRLQGKISGLNLSHYNEYILRTCEIGNSNLPQEFANITQKTVLASKYFYGYNNSGSIGPLYSTGDPNNDETTRWYLPSFIAQPEITTFLPK